MDGSRRQFVVGAGLVLAASSGGVRLMAEGAMVGKPGEAEFDRAAFDSAKMRELANFTAGFLDTAPNPFGCEIVNTKTGESLMRAMNAVMPESDPSAHAEVRTMRLACAKLKSPSLKGYTLYTTCEPCPMCMSDALWAGVDRVVYGATIEDANRFCKQIRIPAVEVVKRSDMVCVVDGPVERAVCVAIFEDPRMQAAFKMWSSAK